MPRTKEGLPIRMRWISTTGRPCLLVEAGDRRLEGYYEREDGSTGDILDFRALEQGLALALDRLRKARFVIDAAKTERETFRAAHRDVELEPEVAEAGLRFANALSAFGREAGAGQPYSERFGPRVR